MSDENASAGSSVAKLNMDRLHHARDDIWLFNTIQQYGRTPIFREMLTCFCLQDFCVDTTPLDSVPSQSHPTSVMAQWQSNSATHDLQSSHLYIQAAKENVHRGLPPTQGSAYSEWLLPVCTWSMLIHYGQGKTDQSAHTTHPLQVHPWVHCHRGTAVAEGRRTSPIVAPCCT